MKSSKRKMGPESKLLLICIIVVTLVAVVEGLIFDKPIMPRIEHVSEDK